MPGSLTHFLRSRTLLWLLGGLLVVLFVAGAPLVPFHGDESQWLYMSGDFDDFFVERDVSRLLYSPSPADPEDQNLRERNHPAAKYVIGLGRTLAVYSRAELNGYWMWGSPWEWQVAHGRLPTAGLLAAARWLPSALAGLGVVALMLMLRLDGWLTALLAGLLTGTSAVYLLHMRRAMAEGTLLAFSTFSVALAVVYLTRQRRSPPLSVPARAGFLLGIGLLTGLAVATKMNGAIAALTVAAALVALRRPEDDLPRTALAAAVDVGVVAALAAGVLLLLSPYLWRDPVGRLRFILEDRARLVEAQSQGRDAFDRPGEALAAMGRALFWAAPSYAEDAIWAEQWVREEIARYEASPLSGWRHPAWARILLIAAFTSGLADLALRRPREDAARTVRRAVLLWLGVSTAVNLLILPFAWQRYYLPQWPAVVSVQAYGLAAALAWLGQPTIRPRKAEPQHAAQH